MNIRSLVRRLMLSWLIRRPTRGGTVRNRPATMTFFSLPLEIRLMIYEIVSEGLVVKTMHWADRGGIFTYCDTYLKKYLPWPYLTKYCNTQLLAVSRRIRHEALPVFFDRPSLVRMPKGALNSGSLPHRVRQLARKAAVLELELDNGDKIVMHRDIEDGFVFLQRQTHVPWGLFTLPDNELRSHCKSRHLRVWASRMDPNTDSWRHAKFIMGLFKCLQEGCLVRCSQVVDPSPDGVHDLYFNKVMAAFSPGEKLLCPITVDIGCHHGAIVRLVSQS
jgi:hypothetical protein